MRGQQQRTTKHDTSSIAIGLFLPLGLTPPPRKRERRINSSGMLMSSKNVTAHNLIAIIVRHIIRSPKSILFRVRALLVPVLRCRGTTTSHKTRVYRAGEIEASNRTSFNSKIYCCIEQNVVQNCKIYCCAIPTTKREPARAVCSIVKTSC